MLMATEEKRGLDEVYETAGNTSNLRIVARTRGAADVIAAAGMAQAFTGAPPPYSQLRTGMALLRLHGEWTASAKPKRMDAASVEAIAARLHKEDEQARFRWGPPNPKAPKPGPVAVRAQKEADRWYVNELRLLATGLKSRAAVWGQLSPWAAIKGVDPEIVAGALLHWLDRTCRACDGLGQGKVAGAPKLNGRICPTCSGTRQAPNPVSMDRVLHYLDESVNRARQSLKKRLRPE